MMSRRRAITATLTLLAIAVAASGAIAYAASSAGSAKANYAVFRKDAKPIDRLSKDGRELARRTPKSLDLHPKDSRRTRLKPGHAVWLIPGGNGVCVFVEQRDGGVRGSCNHLAQALNGALYLAEYRHGKSKSFKEVTGALPDGGGKVRLVGAGGDEKKLKLRNNTYSTHLSREASAKFKPQRITYEVGGQPFSIPL
jgi:hypothetical protein